MKTHNISWSSARRICIVKTLAKLGHYPTRKSEKEAWFLSILRSETQASFNVSLVKNLWYDFGEGKGGNVIDLVMLLLNCTFQESLLYLSENADHFYFRPPAEILKKKPTGEIIISGIQEIKNPALIQFLKHRKIPVGIARKFCKEVQYQIKKKKYYSIGLQNHLGGWELRNKYYKNSSSPKSYTYVSRASKTLLVTEGMFDFLSLATLEEDLVKSSDAIILNSVAFVKNIQVFISEYEEVFLYMDNDLAGEKATIFLLRQFSNATDKRFSYKDYNDLNDKLRDEKRTPIKRKGT
ncbi:DNA primase [Antarcticibacterium arcticum]|uniref:DNA primase n=1 Tax=Antarcticibacterium arcticum TaxID=2585771 RepID=A0A5B8YJB0_9FLAO|nr:toprim domain-containing protein [Antarcticibacterium arcticum]QED36713.1 DNA primase [Antarcticibacterium arcticum]